MNIFPDIKSETANCSRYSNMNQQKVNGATYTPYALASFVADQIMKSAKLPKQGKIRILDPAVGDGALLNALLERFPTTAHQRLEVVGYDNNSSAITVALERLHVAFPNVSLRLECNDFFDCLLNRESLSATELNYFFDLVIANPPYVRTQIIGAQQAQAFAQRFGLTGRVDLYYPFLLGISEILDPEGTAGIITSNRFMTTKSGGTVRRALLSRFRTLKAWDMGDTKLFDAAVLPAVLLVRGTSKPFLPCTNEITYSSIYKTEKPATTNATDIFSALSANITSVVALADGRRFCVKHGKLDNGDDPEGVWRLATQANNAWLKTVENHTWATFDSIGKIRVGVKTTADKIFIRNNWDDLLGGAPELLRPLITRHCGQQYKSRIPAKSQHIKQILYPHEITENGRTPVDLSLYPKAKHYLETYRDTLEARTYIKKAGRRWYEIWVPQDPAAWLSPKLVFPDISEKPMFWIDMGSGVVSGECYWLRNENNTDPDLLWLALAIANSTFIEEFYDYRFNNKLYAGRRRFITQYVELFPLPNPYSQEAKAIVDLAKKIYKNIPSVSINNMTLVLDTMVWQIFGLSYNSKKLRGKGI